MSTEVTRRKFLGSTAASALVMTGVSPPEVDNLKSKARDRDDFVVVVIETTDEMYTSEELSDILDIVTATLDPNLESHQRAMVLQLRPGMKMSIIGGTDDAIRTIREVVVAQTEPTNA